MGKTAIPVQVFSIIGLSAVIGGAHSLFEPVRLDRESTGFTLPEGVGTAADPGGATAPDPDPADRSASDAAGEPATSDTDAVNGVGTEEPNEAPIGDGKISLEVAAQLHERAMMGEPVWFLDARLRNEFDAGRIAGALFMVHTRVSGGEGLDELLMFSPPEAGDLLVIYCTGGDCQASEDTAILLEAAGYTNIAIMAAGYDEWAAAGLPTEGP